MCPYFLHPPFTLQNTIMREMYVSGSTLFEGVSSIEGSDWTDTYLRKDQAKYLCSHPTAKGVNPVTVSIFLEFMKLFAIIQLLTFFILFQQCGSNKKREWKLEKV